MKLFCSHCGVDALYFGCFCEDAPVFVPPSAITADSIIYLQTFHSNVHVLTKLDGPSYPLQQWLDEESVK